MTMIGGSEVNFVLEGWDRLPIWGLLAHSKTLIPALISTQKRSYKVKSELYCRLKTT